MDTDQAQADTPNAGTSPAPAAEKVISTTEAYKATVAADVAAYQARKAKFDQQNDVIVEAAEKGEIDVSPPDDDGADSFAGILGDDVDELPVTDDLTGDEPVVEEEEVAGQPEAGKQKSIRIRPIDEKERDFLELRRKYPNKPTEELMRFAGLLDDPAPVQDFAPPVEEEFSPFRSQSDILEEIFTIKRQKAEMIKGDFDTDAIAAFELREIELLQEKDESARMEGRVMDAFRASEDRVRAENPEYDAFNSIFATRCREIDESWVEAGDRRASNPKKPEIIAAIVRKELGQNPRKPAPKQTQVLTAGASPARRTLALDAPASGAARTSHTPARSLTSVIKSANTPEKYEALKAKFLGR